MQLVTRAKIAELAGVSRSSLTQAVKGRLSPATVGKGHGLKVDLEHSIVQAYIAEKRRTSTPGVVPSVPNATPAAGNHTPGTNAPHDLENHTGRVQDLEQLTIREVALKYGGAAEFSHYVKALKNIADYKVKEQQHLIRRGELIERETTAAALFMLVDVAFKRLVAEMPESVIPQLVPLVLSSGESSGPEAKKLLTDTVSKILKDCKAEIRKKLAKLDKGDEAG
jgi:hypothetical protein